MARILILGGTGDAVELAAHISALPNVEVITALAGRTEHPSVISGQVRTGGFGGSAGLSQYLIEQAIDGVIDATHPFAAQISHHAVTVTKDLRIPLLALVRPPWTRGKGDRWIEVESMEAAASALPNAAKRVFLAIGRKQVGAFVGLTQTWFLMRSIEAPTGKIPNGIVLCDRGPFDLAHERQLLQQYQIDAVVSKNSGGNATYAKIQAARELSLPVIMIQRPSLPQAEKVVDIEGVMKWLARVL